MFTVYSDMNSQMVRWRHPCTHCYCKSSSLEGLLRLSPSIHFIFAVVVSVSRLTCSCWLQLRPYMLGSPATCRWLIADVFPPPGHFMHGMNACHDCGTWDANCIILCKLFCYTSQFYQNVSESLPQCLLCILKNLWLKVFTWFGHGHDKLHSEVESYP